jgi:RES domain
VTGHPEPPERLTSLRLLIKRVRGRWYRIHAGHDDPIHFGRDARNRFDAPGGEYGVLYVGRDAHCAFIETFGHATGVRFVTESSLRLRRLSIVMSSPSAAPLRLVDLRGEGLARMGADATLTSGGDHELSRRWSWALHQHPRTPDGILYRPRHDPTRTSAAFFDRAAPRLTAARAGSLLAPRHARLLADVLDTYGFGLVPG